MEQSSEANEEKQRAEALRQTKILVRISALILVLPLALIGLVLWFDVSKTLTAVNALPLALTLTGVGIFGYIAVAS